MSKWIDVTRTLTNGMVQWPGDRPFRCHRFEEISGPESSNVSEINCCVHVGTHIDAPLHFIKDATDVSEIHISQLCGPATVVEIAESRDITIKDLEKSSIAPGERVLFKTANQSLWEEAKFEKNYVAIGAEAAMWLIDYDVPVVGIDYLSVDRYENETQPVHRALLGNGVVIIEGLDLSQITPGSYEMIALPLKIAGCEGSPARVIIKPVKKRTKKG